MAQTTVTYDFTLLNQLAKQGLQHAADSLSAFSGAALTVSEAAASIRPFAEAPTLHGDPETLIAGVHFGITGDIHGYLLAIFREIDAQILLEALMGERPTSLFALDEMALSALGEAGNILVSSFLSEFEPICGISAEPSPPMVAVEMSGAIIASAIMPVVEQDGDVLLVKASILPADSLVEAASCEVLFLPAPDSWPTLNRAFKLH